MNYGVQGPGLGQSANIQNVLDLISGKKTVGGEIQQAISENVPDKKVVAAYGLGTLVVAAVFFGFFAWYGAKGAETLWGKVYK